MAHEYDLIVIGAGTGGYVAAIRAAQLGLRVAVVEKQKALGGTCLLWGCIPTKALLEHAHALKMVQQSKEWGITFGPADAARPAVGIDMTQVQTRKDRIVGGLSKGIEYLFKKNKIDWIKGTARLTGNGGVEVFEGDAQTLRATKEIVIATGSTPRGVPGVVDRSQANHHQRRGDRAARGSQGDCHHGQRRGRRGVRVDLPPLRQRGDHSRAVAAPRAGRRRSGIGGARKVVPEAGDYLSHRRKGDRRDGNRRRRGHRRATRRRNVAADPRRLSPGRDRPRTGDDRTRHRAARPAGREGLHQGRRAISDDACPEFPRSAMSSRSARPDILSSLTCRRPKASSPPSASRVRRRGRSTTGTCRAAPTATRRSAASA